MSIYLDYQASTPCDPAVVAAMAPWWHERAANPHSAHARGRAAKAAVEAARAHVARLIGAEADEIIFTSGATESNNLALKGVILNAAPARRALLTLPTEHSCVLETARHLEQLGAPLAFAPVGADGLVDPLAFARHCSDRLALASVMLVNNEIGVVQDVAAIARAVKHWGGLMHCDAAQGFGKLPIDVDAMGIDLLSISGHKIHGPQGIGALFVRKGVALQPLLHGGGQEGAGLRSGTVPVALAVGLGEAARIAAGRMAEDDAHARRLRDRLLAALPPDTIVNGSQASRIASNLNLRFEGVDGTRLLAELRGIDVSSGAACASAAGRSSHVLAALGLSRAEVAGSIRIGWGRFSTDDDIDAAAVRISAAVTKLRSRAA